MRHFAIGLALLFIASAAVAAEQTAVAIYKDRFKPPERMAAAKLIDLKDVSAAWIWSDNTPPQRTESVTAIPKPSAVRTISLRIERGSGTAKSLTLVAAPAEMWQEVPEDLLPSRKIELNRKDVAVPIAANAGPWRLRLTGFDSGTWWIDVAPSQRQVTIPLLSAPDRKIEVRGEDGKPIPRVRLSVVDGGAERGDFQKLTEYRTGDDGRITLGGVPDFATATLVFSAADRAPFVVEAKPSQFPAVITMRRGHEVVGKLTTRKGEPIANALVVVKTWISDLLPVPLRREGNSDANGQWRLGQLPDGKGEWEVSARGFADTSLPVTFDKETIDLGTIALEPAAIADVLVIDDRGEPIERAAIATGSRILATTDAKGRAWLAITERQSLDVRVTATHHRTLTMTLDTPAGHLTKLVLQRSFRLTGRLVDATGTGVASGRTRAHTGARWEMGELQPDGRFDLDLEPDIDYEVELTSPRTAVAKVTVPKGAAGEVRDLGDVAAPAALTIAGRLVLDSDGSPVAGARIWLPRPSQNGPLMAWAFRDMLETTSGADGRFELAGVPKIPVQLRIDAPSLASMRRAVSPPSEGDRVDVGDLALVSGATVVIRLEGEVGDDVVGRVDTGGIGLPMDSLSASVVGGTARVTGVPPGSVIASAWRKRDMLCRQDVVVPAGGGEVEVRCNQRKVAVTGTVKVGGRPTGPGTLVWLTPAPPDLATGIFNFGSGAMQQQQVFAPDRPQETVEVSTDGRFEGPRLLPGLWEVLWMPERGRGLAPKQITIPDADVHTVTLEYPGVAVDGVVLDSNRKPVAGADVRDVGSHGFAVSRDDGTFTLSGPDAGTWRLQARLAGRQSDVVDVVVDDRPERPHVELLLNSDQTSVRVATARGAMVFLETDDGHLDFVTADDAGIAAFRVVPPLPARVRAAATADGRWSLGDWMSWADAMKEPIALVPGAAGNVIVRTKGASGSVAITSMNGWRLDRLFQWVGSFLRLTSGSDLTVAGLPPGTYTFGVASQQRTASVERDKTLEVTFD